MSVATHAKPNFKLEQHQFEGPLDLLLELIEEKKLPINQVALAEVTEQFLNHVRQMEQVAPEILADFLVIAGKLLVIKSRALLPTLQIEGEDEDAATDLASQLLLLKKYREVVRHLREFEATRKQMFAREAFLGEQVVFFPDPAVDIKLLHEMAKKLAAAVEAIAKPQQHTVAEVVSISEKIEHLQRTLSQKVEASLSEIIKNAETKTEAIVTFLALLELIKQKVFNVEQQELFADIIIRKENN